MNNASLVRYIVGTTGSGKTSLATHFAKRAESVIISADSRQLYRGMDVVTGKDHPQDLLIYGLDLLYPNETGSVSVWFHHIRPVIDQSIKAGKQIIVVGGTGLYVQALTNGIPTMQIPPNPWLRANLEKLSVTELKDKLFAVASEKFVSLNHSDQNNPRRLIRALEVAHTPLKKSSKIHTYPPISPLIGLYYADINLHEKVIRDRVVARLENGAITETKELLKSYDAQLPSMTAFGYHEIISYINKEISQDQLVELWTKSELAYVKRQLTYFRKQNVVWYDRGRMTIEEIYEHLSS